MGRGGCEKEADLRAFGLMFLPLTFMLSLSLFVQWVTGVFVLASIHHSSSSIPVFDTRKYVRTLRDDGGFGEKQADSQSHALHGALQGLATKADIMLLQVQVESLVREMQGFRQEMQVLRQEMQALRQETQALRQFMMIGMMAGFGWMTLMIGLVTAVFKFL